MSIQKMIRDSEPLTFKPVISKSSNILVKKLRSRSLNNSADNRLDKMFKKLKKNELSLSKRPNDNIFLKNMEKVFIL